MQRVLNARRLTNDSGTVRLSLPPLNAVAIERELKPREM